VLRFLTGGESHGPQLTVIVEGLPAGLEVSEEDLRKDLARRQGGHGRGGRQKIETDVARIVSGVRGGYTIGSPVTLVLVNRDHENWTAEMTASKEGFAPKPVTRLRPGHADLAGALKYGHTDIRNVLERSSPRAVWRGSSSPRSESRSSPSRSPSAPRTSASTASTRGS
jgi:chorismate synthase